MWASIFDKGIGTTLSSQSKRQKAKGKLKGRDRNGSFGYANDSDWS
jgi:hypothetical protein